MKVLITAASIAIVFMLTVHLLPVYAHEAEGSAVMHMNRSGYEPKDITIEENSRIIFENTDTVEHWPASNIHPTHAIYSEFDPKKPVPAGMSWEFTFDKPGSWKYHDHLYPEITGTITVTAKDGKKKVPEGKSPEFVLSLLDKIKIRLSQIYYTLLPGKKLAFLEKTNMHEAAGDPYTLRYYLSLFGSETVMDEISKDSGGGSDFDCHTQAHLAGRAAYEIFGASVFKITNYNCHSGFVHGAMESFLSQKGTLNLSQDIQTLCDEFPTNFSRFECLHGVGHGLMAYENYNLPEAIKACRKLPNEFSQMSCYGGVFMENVMAAEGNGAVTDHKTEWVSNDPYFPCNIFDSDRNVQTQCYLMQTSRMLQLFDNSFERVAETCLSAPRSLQITCFQSMGRDAAGYSLRDAQKIIEKCSLAPAEFQRDCYAGALSAIIDFWGTGIDSKPAEFCQALAPEIKAACYTHLGQRMDTLFENDDGEKRRHCSFSESEEYRKVCEQSAGIPI